MTRFELDDSESGIVPFPMSLQDVVGDRVVAMNDMSGYGRVGAITIGSGSSTTTAGGSVNAENCRLGGEYP